MKNKDLKKLNRKELLELFLPLSRENDALKKENQILQKKSDNTNKSNTELISKLKLEQDGEKVNTQIIEEELNRVNEKKSVFKIITRILATLIIVAAVTVLLSSFAFSVLRVTGVSMRPTLDTQEVIIVAKKYNLQCGDIVAFYYNNEILIKRVIATSGQIVDINEQGDVYVDGKQLDEPYVMDKNRGKCDINLPFQVPEGKFFVMGDSRKSSVDSRNSTIGCISDKYIEGKVIFRLWPFNKISLL
ncbi:MAG: signal peptidase I [Eubacterium sp.]|nr:signal peptidase I [Eubacterium sp.]